jgi:hypothetical protein
LRYAIESYHSILEATNQLKTMMKELPKGKRAEVRKSRVRR